MDDQLFVESLSTKKGLFVDKDCHPERPSLVILSGAAGGVKDLLERNRLDIQSGRLVILNEVKDLGV